MCNAADEALHDFLYAQKETSTTTTFGTVLTTTMVNPSDVFFAVGAC